jgi:hypothetical protein
MISYHIILLYIILYIVATGAFYGVLDGFQWEVRLVSDSDSDSSSGEMEMEDP